MKVLITGFEPLWGITKSPSGEVCKLWRDGLLTIKGVEVKALILPQEFGKSSNITCNEIQAYEPNIVLMFGATQHNDPLRLERFAINLEHTAIGDNTKIPVNERKVIHDGPAAYESHLPIHKLSEHLNSIGVDTRPSYFAGTHVCNSQFYKVLHFLSTFKAKNKICAGFVHIPFPNEYGVLENTSWSVSSFQGIARASVELMKATTLWYQSTKMTAETTI